MVQKVQVAKETVIASEISNSSFDATKAEDFSVFY
jgi:hypothetical protein